MSVEGRMAGTTDHQVNIVVLRRQFLCNLLAQISTQLSQILFGKLRCVHEAVLARRESNKKEGVSCVHFHILLQNFD